jgi:hypothetical protein
MVAGNASTSFTVTPAIGYQIVSVTGCGGSLSGTNYTTGAINGDCSVVVVTIPTTGPAHSGILIFANDKTTPDIGDALRSFQFIMGIRPLNTAELAAADVAPLGADGKPAGNGIVDVGDVVVILRRVVGASNW